MLTCGVISRRSDRNDASPSLTDISIHRFENLEFMCSKGLQHLTSLQRLAIYDCPKLASLPEKDMLLSLERLFIWRCPLVARRRVQ
ncbi:hypothetical protein ERO13_D11G330275v2 [Gossypium hirsutum]|nr:hypothetical protein ERO13_D11G330275v2 [Gossypium hirsutum]